MSESSRIGGLKTLAPRHFSAWAAPGSNPSQRLSVFLCKLLAAEFAAIAASAYVATVAYHVAIWNQGPSVEKYIGASVGLATLILVISLALQHYDEIQIQPRHKFLWSGMGAVLLAFSL